MLVVVPFNLRQATEKVHVLALRVHQGHMLRAAEDQGTLRKAANQRFMGIVLVMGMAMASMVSNKASAS